jgi:hypothetical protein
VRRNEGFLGTHDAIVQVWRNPAEVSEIEGIYPGTLCFPCGLQVDGIVDQAARPSLRCALAQDFGVVGTRQSLNFKERQNIFLDNSPCFGW